MATISENLAIAKTIADEIPDRDVYQISVANDEVRVHLCWLAFQRLFGGQEVGISNGTVTKVDGIVTYAAQMRREPTHGSMICPVPEAEAVT